VTAPLAGGPVEEELREHVRLQVRAGYLAGPDLLREVEGRVAAALPDLDAGVLARAWLAAEQRALAADAAAWPVPTDHERVARALAECAEHGVLVAEAVLDDAGAAAALRAAGTAPARGVLWFRLSDVAAALHHGVLRWRLRDPHGRALAPDAPLVAAVRGCAERHGLTARAAAPDPDAGVEVRCRWQRRPGAVPTPSGTAAATTTDPSTAGGPA